MKKEIYEDIYKKSNHFGFGKNWQNFLKSLDNEKIEEAKKSMVEFLGGENNIKGKTFIDIGCGSGLFSYAAFKLGAKKVVSVDVDEFSVACAKYLKEKEKNPDNWEIKQGSALDENFIKSLGQFDIVYSWGVLHHTGNMYKALENIIILLGKQGYLYIAIYNKFIFSWRGGTSRTWLKIKKLYNNVNLIGKKIIESIFIFYCITILLLRFHNPISYIKKYRNNRGMNWYHDIVDWLGGYPYEFAGPEEIINFFGAKGYYCKKLFFRNGTGCNEFLFVNTKIDNYEK